MSNWLEWKYSFYADYWNFQVEQQDIPQQNPEVNLNSQCKLLVFYKIFYLNIFIEDVLDIFFIVNHVYWNVMYTYFTSNIPIKVLKLKFK